MCGICGILDNQSRLSPIFEMNKIQRHRGPNDEGYLFINKDNGSWKTASGPDTHPEVDLPSFQSIEPSRYNLVFGSRRLSILDLSAGGHMPMPYSEGKFWITYNGEIYNYLELKQELVQLGHSFTNGTDTEVILAAYAEWGTECLSHFNGMFAFALWDAIRQRLFCARDRFGIKPLYYYWNQATFVFASELKSLIQHPVVPRLPNDQTIFDYLALGLSDHSEQTFFKDILSLPPAHFLVIDVREGSLHLQKWWQAEINPSIDGFSVNHEQTRYDEFAGLLEDAIRLRLRSDVPVGSCLSGGLDSSSIVLLANRLLLNEQVIPRQLVGERQKTFTARNNETEIDEYFYSHKITQQTGAEENIVFPDGEKLWNEIGSFVWHMDEPVDSTSQYPQWNVMRLARERGVTVLLDGQGGDEILAGYYSYLPTYLSQVRQQRGALSALQAGLAVTRVGGKPALDVLFEHGTYQLPWHLQQLVRGIRPPQIGPGQGGSGLKEWQLSKSFMHRFSDRKWQPPSPSDSNGLVGVLYRDLTSTNLPKLLRYEDRNSMAFSLETRLPFLDYRLVEMVFSLPLDYRIHNGWTKWILRHSLNEVLPQEICWRRSKLGFPTPELNWLAEGTKTIRNLLKTNDNEQLAAYVQPGVFSDLLEKSDVDLVSTPGLWRITNLVIWLNLFINGNFLRDMENVIQSGVGR